MRAIWRVLKYIFGAFALLMIIAIGVALYDVISVRMDTNHSRESFGIGNSIYEFWVPKGSLIFIRFSYRSKSAYCLKATLNSNNELTVELPDKHNKSQKLENRQDLPSALQTYRENIRECDTIGMSVIGRLTPQAGWFSIYYSDETVTGSKEPAFGD